MDKRKFIVIGFVIMCFNSLYQYSWNALEPILRSSLEVSLVQVSLGFSLFSLFSSGFQPIGGHFADKQGPKKVGLISAFLSSLGFLGTYFFHNIYVFYFFWSLGSIGEGILYGIAANLAMKWFKERMAFATGIVSMGFGLGSAIANPFIATFANYDVFLIIGLVEVILLPLLLYFVDYPPRLTGKPPGEVILTGKFWLIYVSFVTAVVPLTVMSSQLPTLGKGLPQSTLILLISLLPLLSGGLRPFFGLLADRLGIINTTLLLNVIITLGALSLMLGNIVVATVLIGFAGGSMITLYFNVAGAIFGTKFSTVNSGLLYTGKGLGGVMGSVVFAILYNIGLFTSELYTFLCGVVSVITLLAVIQRSKVSSKR